MMRSPSSWWRRSPEPGNVETTGRWWQVGAGQRPPSTSHLLLRLGRQNTTRHLHCHCPASLISLALSWQSCIYHHPTIPHQQQHSVHCVQTQVSEVELGPGLMPAHQAPDGVVSGTTRSNCREQISRRRKTVLLGQHASPGPSWPVAVAATTRQVLLAVGCCCCSILCCLCRTRAQQSNNLGLYRSSKIQEPR